MKLAKMSLAAAMLLGGSVYAFENTAVNGDARVFYYTVDGKDADLFDKASSAADAALRLSVTTDFAEGVSGGATAYALSTLGLEKNTVDGVWSGAHLDENGDLVHPTAMWISDLWISGTAGKTTGKVGRMELDTPLAFTETWGIAPNTFEALTVTNEDIPDTTLLGAWIANGNGVNGYYIVGENGDFDKFNEDGAYVAGAVNNSYKPLTIQGWYYDVVYAAQAYWLQADFEMAGFVAGVQYANVNPNDDITPADDSAAYAAKLGYNGVENLGLSVAYSTTDDSGDADFQIANFATGGNGGAMSKLYTEAWWNFGYVGAPGTDAINVTAEYSFPDIVDLGAYIISSDQDEDNGNTDMNEVTVTASKSFGNLDTCLAYVYTEADDVNEGDGFNNIQVYLTYNFSN
jgi:imipenem/basic amino acid-specific outer membrane pore